MPDETELPSRPLPHLPAELEEAAPLENPRWERFAQLRALANMGVQEAYKAMGGQGDAHEQGGKLSRRPEIQARIRQLLLEEKRRLASRVDYTRDDLIRETWRAIWDARHGVALHQGEIVTDPETGLPVFKVDNKAVLIALELLGREIGVFPREAKILHGRTDPVDDLSFDQLLDLFCVTAAEASEGRIHVDRELLRSALLGEPDGGTAAADGDREEGSS